MQLNGFDLFAGAGGLSEGFIQAGFNIIGSVEKDHWACETQKTRHIYHYLKNKGQDKLKEYWDYCNNLKSVDDITNCRKILYENNPGLQKEIENTIWEYEFGKTSDGKNTVETKNIIDKLKQSMKFQHLKKVDFILGGPPCQAYSIVGRSKMGDAVKEDKRNFLFTYYIEIVKIFEPEFFLFENVPGIITAQDGEIYKKIKEGFKKIGYEFIPGLDELNIKNNINIAANFGVPQTRKRFIFLGVKEGSKLKYPIFNFTSNHLNTSSAIGDLPELQAGNGSDQGIEFYKHYPLDRELTDYQKEMRYDSIGIMNHMARPINKSYDREIYKMAIEKSKVGETINYANLPSELKKHNNQRSFTDRFKVHPLHKTPHTIVAHISKDGHYNIHPSQVRSLTVREAARIQSFPDNFKFEGPRTAQFTQVGNAVPPKMARAFAEKLLKQLSIEENNL